MKVPYRWLMDYVEGEEITQLSPQELAERLTMTGAKVEGWERLGGEWRGIVVGRVASLQPHPQADNLVVCQVDTGEQTYQVVTGATNLQEGDRVPMAPPGAQLPEGPAVREVDLRGEASQGMVCSEAELGVGEDADGIMILHPEAPVGQPLAEALGLDDVVLEFEIYPNRPDCLGVVGIAREVAAMAGVGLKLPSVVVDESDSPVEEATSVEVLDPELCPHYCARVIRDVRVGPSPLWLQQRLRAAGMRPINNVVDVTNYVMLETGQPLHPFDHDHLAEGRVVVRRARVGERMRTLDGQDRELYGDTLVIADAGSPACIAGVMGGDDSEVSESTTTVLLEAANFNPASIRRTARSLGLRSEASLRFEKGLDPAGTVQAVNRAAQLIRELTGGTILAGIAQQSAVTPDRHEITLQPEWVNAFLGTTIPASEMETLLLRLGFQVQADGADLRVQVPSFRPDVTRREDLAEEIARLHGFHRIPATMPQGAGEPGGQDDPLPVVDRLREILVGCGLREAVTYSFASPRAFDRLRLSPDDPLRRCVELRNPLTEDHTILRTTLLDHLLQLVGHNVARRVEHVHAFEIGAVFRPHELPLQTLPEEKRHLGLVMVGRPPEKGWGLPAHAVDFYHLKGVVEEIFDRLGITAEFTAAGHPAFHPGRHARILVGDREIGVLGEVHPETAAAHEIKQRIYLAELDVDLLAESQRPEPRFRPLPRHPAVARDLALLVPQATAAGDVQKIMVQEGGDILENISLFDVYEGEQIPAGMRSLAFALMFRAPGRTLTDDEVTLVQERMEQVLQDRLGVEIRR